MVTFVIIQYLLCVKIYALNDFEFSNNNLSSASLSNYSIVFDEYNYFNDDSNTLMVTYQLPDGEIITKLKWNKSFAIETKYDYLSLRQISDGIHMIQLWLTDNELIDCEFITDKYSVNELYRQFLNDIPNLYNSKESIINNNQSQYAHIHQNASYLSYILNNTDNEQLSPLINYNQWHDMCHQLHVNLRSKYHITNNNKKRRSKKSERWKRADLFVFPGTNWCGKGSNSRTFNQLGEHALADSCCRDHDSCKYTIGPFEKKYRLFNYRLHYVSHCECDERFRACLKLSNTGAANLIGKLFFNVIQTKCFMFKTERMCSKRSWWGKCLKKRKRKRAYFRNGLRY